MDIKLKITHFFSTSFVKKQLIKGTLPEGQLFLYFYLILMYDALGLTQQCLAMIGKQVTLVDKVYIVGYLITTAIGLLILFIANGAFKGKNFVSKFFAFSFTIGFKYGIALIIFSYFSFFLYPSLRQAYEVAVYILMNLLMVTNIAFRIYQTRHTKLSSYRGQDFHDEV